MTLPLSVSLSPVLVPCPLSNYSYSYALVLSQQSIPQPCSYSLSAASYSQSPSFYLSLHSYIFHCSYLCPSPPCVLLASCPLSCSYPSAPVPCSVPYPLSSCPLFFPYPSAPTPCPVPYPSPPIPCLSPIPLLPCCRYHDNLRGLDGTLCVPTGGPTYTAVANGWPCSASRHQTTPRANTA